MLHHVLGEGLHDAQAAILQTGVNEVEAVAVQTDEACLGKYGVEHLQVPQVADGLVAPDPLLLEVQVRGHDAIDDGAGLCDHLVLVPRIVHSSWAHKGPRLISPGLAISEWVSRMYRSKVEPDRGPERMNRGSETMARL